MMIFNLPDLGEGLQQAEVVAWHVAEGDHVVADQPLVAVETEKAVVEIPSPHAGHIARLFANPGDRVRVGTPLLAFEEGPHRETGTVVGTLAEAEPQHPSGRPPPSAVGRPTESLRASPAVRARARELGIDLSRVAPSGPGGSITINDVMAAVSSRAPPSERDTEILRGARRTMAVNMARAGREVVPATLYDEADIEAWPAREDVTVRLIRAILRGLGAEPALNASFDSKSPSLRRNAHVDLGLAVDSPDGLFVPVLREAERYGPPAWRKRIDELKQGVHDRSLTLDEFRDPTITLSNFGPIAGRYAALVVVPPQVAIVGAGRVSARPVPARDAVVFHRLLPLSVTFDHRAINGGEAARFMRAMISDLERSS
jgi:pyruvate dehydrogenase E2 component (dihydrolipoamide acetyltransferase)